ncbi:DNA polymerase III subunit alpha [Nonomuraea indica]|uniref:DNA polymerase III subunit alpha n=1 Tax=Nonomuraea indica TaxID=1581193 RepID=UPI000C7C8FCA|nr:DNA polymerase III subunit alpha [Nonomuraea indica]
MAPFPHLNVCSAYSMRYGTAFPQALARRAADDGMDILALTDRDGLYGAVKHAQACADAGIAPVFGVDLALAGAEDGARPERDDMLPGFTALESRPRRPRPRTGPDAEHRVTVLARSHGWSRLARLVTAAHHAGERGAPRVTRELVAAHDAPGSGGLVVLLGPRSDVGRAVAERRDEHARALLGRWRSLVPGVVVELVDQYGYRDATNAAHMLGLAESLGVPAVLTNAVRHLDPADHQVGDVLDAARQLVPLHPRHLDRTTSHAYLKTSKDMLQVAARICGGDQSRTAALLRTTRRIAEQCVIDPLELLALRGDPPALHLPEIGADPVPLLRRRVEDGLAARGLARSGDARERLRAEMDIIERKSLSGYFIAVSGITDMIREMGIRCAIRGSGAGSLVTYLLGIGEVNPLHHGLLMERFLSEGRVGLPDIDVDVESARRLDCYKAIFERYGEERVACVSMMETYRARSAIRDVAGAMGLPPHEIDAIAKAFPHIRARQITASLSDLPELRDSRLGEAGLDRVFRLAEKLDGLPRHIALHPCGVLIGNATLRDRTPVERSLLEFPMSQFDKDDVEEAGLLKLDVLGVRMQSAMAYTLSEIKRVDDVVVALDEQGGDDPAVQYVPRDDRDTYDMICAGRTLGCFQIESPGQRELVSKLEPRTMHDLIVDISLFRPGPVNSDMITPYLEARHGWREPRYPHRRLHAALKETHGVVVFHEQVLRVIEVMTGRDLSFAEMLRRSLGTPEGRELVRRTFVPLARANGFDDATVERAWEVLDAFGGFGFCKAHAAAFALPTYQSAWLKRHHAAAFFAGVLTHEPGMYPQRVIIDEARQCGVTILPLDVNRSGKDWQVERLGPRPPVRIGVPAGALADPGEGPEPGEETEHGEETQGEGTGPEGGTGPGEGAGPVRRRAFRPEELGRGYALRVPFSAVKGVSEAEVERMVAGRPYTSLADFWDRARPSRPTAERIVQVGGLDALHDLHPGGPRWRPGRLTRRDLVAQVGALERTSTSGISTARRSRRYAAPPTGPDPAALAPASTDPARTDPGTGPARTDPVRPAGEPPAVQLPLGFGEHIPPGELPEMTEAEMVEAELEILGIDVSRHVITFHAELLDAVGVVRAKDLQAQRNGAEVLVAGVKVATQTPAVRSGQRIIFTTLDDSTGPVDLTFFESVQGRCAATVFGAWLMVARGVVRRTGVRAVTLRALDCWDLAALDRLWRSAGIEAVREVLARPSGEQVAGGVGGRPIEYANGFRLSPYSDLGPAVSAPPRRLWHSSPGSSGPTAA